MWLKLKAINLYNHNNNLSVYHQNIINSADKINELLISANNAHSPHTLHLTEYHIKLPEILCVTFI